jgi:hypothetical protein
MIHDLGNDLIPVLAIALSFAFGMFWILCDTIDSIHKTARNSRLKELLIERGSSADEIERIVGIGSSGVEPVNRPVPPVKSTRPVHG